LTVAGSRIFASGARATFALDDIFEDGSTYNLVQPARQNPAAGTSVSSRRRGLAR
jgi:hypothetical protein